MANLWWGSAAALTAIGALFYWAGAVFALDRFYRDACVILLAGLLCLALAIF